MAVLLDFDLVTLLSLLVAVLVLALLLAVRRYRARLAEMEARLREAQSSKQSLATTYGRITEQFAPFLASYPFDPKDFRFIGSPVDGIQFAEDRIVFVEFKANNSRLTERENRIRRLVEAGRVEWLEFRVEERPAAGESMWGAGR